MQKKPVIAGNWKMNKTVSETVQFLEELKKRIWGYDKTDIIIFPSCVSLFRASEIAKGTNISLGAQNMYCYEHGAFTGETSPIMIKDYVQYILVGHSERRHIFHEHNESIRKKLDSAIKNQLTAVLCIGETLEEREKGLTNDVLTVQLYGALDDKKAEDLRYLIIAYEPVWAIGTDRVATPEDAESQHKFIREMIGKKFGPDAARDIRILYGGSVKPDNIKDLMSKQDIDGALVGGASLDIDSFEKLIRFAD
jgi:triosephosphate isomerase